MNQKQISKDVLKAIFGRLDTAAKKYGLQVTRTVAGRWLNVQREQASIARRLDALEQQKAELSRRLGR